MNNVNTNSGKGSYTLLFTLPAVAPLADTRHEKFVTSAEEALGAAEKLLAQARASRVSVYNPEGKCLASFQGRDWSRY